MEEGFIYIIAGTVFLFLTSVFLVRPIPNFSYKQLAGIATVIVAPTLSIFALSNSYWPVGFLNLSGNFGDLFVQVLTFYNLYLIPFALLLCASLLATSMLSYLTKRPQSQSYNLAISLFIPNMLFWSIVNLIAYSGLLGWSISEQRAPWVLVIQILSTVSLYTAITAFTTLLLSKKAFKMNHWKVRKVTLCVLLLAGILFLMFEYLADVVTDRPAYEPTPIVKSV